MKEDSSFFRPAVPLRLLKFLIRSGLAKNLKDFQVRSKGDTSALQFLSDAVLSAPINGLEALEKITEASESERSDLIDLSIGYPHGDDVCLHALPAAIQWAAAHGVVLDGYPPYSGWPAVLNAISGELQNTTGQAFRPGVETILTSGATQGLALIAECFVNPGDAVVLLEPAYLFLAYPLKLKRAALRWVQTTVVDGEVVLDESALAKALAGAKLLILNSPANPNGAIISKELMGRVLRLAERFGVLVASDEIYQDFCFEKSWTSAGAFPEYRNRVIINHSYSKSFRMAGWRMGYLATSEALIRPLKMASALLVPYAPSISQALVGSLLSEKAAITLKLRQKLQRLAQATFELLSQSHPDAKRPHAGLFHWLPIPAKFSSGSEYSEFLRRERRILVMPGEHFGPHSKRFVRLSFAAEETNVKEACRRLAESK